VYGDPVVAGALGVAFVAELAVEGVVPDRPEAAVLALLATAPLAYRRRLPLASFIVLWGAMFALGALVAGVADTSVTFLAVFFLSLYSLGAHARGLAAWVGGFLVTAGVVIFVVSDGDPFATGDVLFGAMIVGGPWAAGTAIRLRRDRERTLTAQTARLERDQAEFAQQAVAEERRRIARELHDVVSHAISVTVLQARGGRRMLEVDLTEAREAFTVIEHTNAQALSDMRRLLALLHDAADTAGEPLPSLATLDGLVAGVRSSGLAVDLEITGDLSAIPPGIGLSAYRIVQEALTNVLRHAGGARTEVAVRCHDRDLEVVVTDDGLGGSGDSGGPNALPGTGHGLIGMRERVAVTGGHLEVGRVDGGQFRVRAVLPYEVAA